MTIKINRAPVLTLWGVVVARHAGYDEDAALTLGKALAGLNAQSKGRSLGIFGPTKATAEEGKPKKTGLGDEMWITACGRSLPAKNTEAGIRAVTGDQPLEPGPVRRYLEKAFGEALPEVRAAMEALASAFSPPAFDEKAFGLYERFRPAIQSGAAGWGQKGELDLDKVRGRRGRVAGYGAATSASAHASTEVARRTAS